MHEAASRGNPDITRLLVDSGVDVNITGSDRKGWTPLHEAAARGNVEVAKVLLLAGAKVNAATDESQYTPIFEPALRGYKEMVRLLIDNGADVNWKTGKGIQPLRCALLGGDADTIEAVKDAGAKTDEVSHKSQRR